MKDLDEYLAVDEMTWGIRVCEFGFSRRVLLAVDPRTVCMIGGPGTEFCLLGRCFEIQLNMNGPDDTPRQDPATIVPINYEEGSDLRTEVCRRLLSEYQKQHRT